MNISASLFSEDGDEYRISLSSAADERLSEAVRKRLSLDHIEIVEVFLERVKGIGFTSNSTLCKITDVIARMFSENENMIIFFYCDDLGGIPTFRKSRSKDMYPQKYRSRLFSCMFERYMSAHDSIPIDNYPMHIGEGRYEAYLHFIARREHEIYVKLIKDDIYEGYGK